MPTRAEINAARILDGMEQGKFPDFETVFAEVRPQWDTTHAKIVDKDIVICDAYPTKTQYGDAFVCGCMVDGELIQVLIGGMVLYDQLELLLNKLPIRARIIHEKRYYEFA